MLKMNYPAAALIAAAYYHLNAAVGYISSLAASRMKNASIKGEAVIKCALICLFDAAFFYLLARRIDIPRSVGLSAKTVLFGIACAAALFIVCEYAIKRIFARSMPDLMERHENGVAVIKKTPFVSAILILIAAPICEELLFRSIILGGLAENCGIVGAALFSTAVFALIHINPFKVTVALICGAALTAAYLLTRSVYVCILIHILFNALSFFWDARKAKKNESE